MFYTAFYEGHGAEELHNILERRDLNLVDVRLIPRSNQQGWDTVDLAKLLGSRYRWIRALANKHYIHNCQSEIVNPSAGMVQLMKVARGNGVVLLIGLKDCKRPGEPSHRQLLTELVKTTGIPCEDFEWSADRQLRQVTFYRRTLNPGTRLATPEENARHRERLFQQYVRELEVEAAIEEYDQDWQEERRAARERAAYYAPLLDYLSTDDGADYFYSLLNDRMQNQVHRRTEDLLQYDGWVNVRRGSARWEKARREAVCLVARERIEMTAARQVSLPEQQSREELPALF